MSKTLRVVVPPHPLIGHWLTLLRDRQTPGALYASAMAELGRWLTYEALRDWIPYQRVLVETPLARTEGTVVDGRVPLLAIPMAPAGLGLWEGARPVVPRAAVAYGALPEPIPTNAGVLVFAEPLASASDLIALLEQLDAKGVSGSRLRVLSAVAASPALKQLGECYGDLTLYTSCIDAECDEEGRILPGIGDAAARLYGFEQAESLV